MKVCRGCSLLRSLLIAGAVLLIGGSSVKGAYPRVSRHGMVVADEATAARVGVQILQKGGNAVDAAVAVAFALAVTHPAAGNLGGGGFMLVRLQDGTVNFLDFREVAPLGSRADMYLNRAGQPTADSRIGWRASGVPGTVRGLEHAWKKYGRLKWQELLEPAIRLAEKGFRVDYWFAQQLREHADKLSRFETSRRIFLKNGQYYQPGELFRQPELAWTLRRIAEYGAKDFYEGEIARRLAAEMERHGGLIGLEDLKRYRVKERQPLAGEYRGYEIITVPPPSSGGIGVLQMLGMLEPTKYYREGAGSAEVIHYVAEVMKRYFADRATYLGDPDFTALPLKGLLDPEYIAARRKSIDPRRATPAKELGPGDPWKYESLETTHISVVDEKRNAVSLTYTLNGSFGSGVTVAGLGFLLNNEMDDFTVKVGEPNLFGLIQGRANEISPGKRPLSSMTPTIVLQDGKLAYVLGSPGGPKIITSVLQVLLNLIDFKMNLQEAVNWPRVHHQWQPDVLEVERGISPDTIRLLEAKGHQIRRDAVVGNVLAIACVGEWLHGAADPRRHGIAEGY